jgi:hypothetical protein
MAGAKNNIFFLKEMFDNKWLVTALNESFHIFHTKKKSISSGFYSILKIFLRGKQKPSWFGEYKNMKRTLNRERVM